MSGRLCDRRHGLGSTKNEPVLLMDFCDPAGVAIYEEFFALLGGVGAMRPDDMRRWEGGTWSM